MEVRFFRGEELQREPHQLPAALYKLVHLLFTRLEGESLFVPIRSMQYLAVIDNEEIVFVDGQGPRSIELAWQRFRPQERAGLHEPVPYDCVFYEEKGRQTMKRLQGEFFNALRLLEERRLRAEGGASITSLNRES
ncbi:MAG TPA: hypothetical protein ENJ79_01515 [Gammaproteobacteria bacterium]|nr:hypothetical protein [Gammaproteobacteria bacterium]